MPQVAAVFKLLADSSPHMRAAAAQLAAGLLEDRGSTLLVRLGIDGLADSFTEPGQKTRHRQAVSSSSCSSCSSSTAHMRAAAAQLAAGLLEDPASTLLVCTDGSDPT